MAKIAIKSLIKAFNGKKPGAAALIDADGGIFTVEFSNKESIELFKKHAEQSLEAAVSATDMEKSGKKFRVTFSAEEKSPIDEIIGILKRYDEGAYTRREEDED